MMTKKGKVIFVLIFSVVLVIGVVGWQVLKLYTQSNSTDTANVATSEETISKNKTTDTMETNNTESEQMLKKQVEEEVQSQVKKEQEVVKQRVTDFSSTFLTYTSKTATTDFEKAARYMTKQAQSANQPNTDEKYETNQGIYKQAAGEVDVYLDMPLNGKEASFISIVACHSESDVGASADFPLLLKGELEKQEDNTWLISQVVIGNPANFPEVFFQ
ncbi:hypothetical protein HB837_14560 [Listeria innocua]|uniref:hypothetical protein n=1 Tax=Listeria innocua TaxID=1642 RepID=UPI00162712E1|nr:hypothetical protein [Listeria innocua]MBC1339418.1 hypothetical protein [Listeria innocua]MBC1353658.1 hypothetical protein [Listeria innocua]